MVARSAVSRTEVREEGREMLVARSQVPASARRLPAARRASAEVVVSIPGVNTRTFIDRHYQDRQSTVTPAPNTT